ncbi:hypothetical protein A4D02_34590 [Niastella koreensis]|uniref:OmpA-like domain-containing protein n=2 Tax=Niastella koreensis TaxID=354356 RepID=G8TRR0_NIAKG|nr:hypothetical protein [Niastella koreensis]AEW02207.1 hypothetical protein Niako_5978 [Niastella koreensis GR20-10]OQP45081.1 hypothetical protein A4D02_34590 [Niastella koreensis]
MIRTFILMGLMAMSMLMASCILGCPSHAVQSLTKTRQEILELVKKEFMGAISLTVEKVKKYEMDPDIGKEIIRSIRNEERKIDTQLAVVQQLELNGTKEEIFQFAERSELIVNRAETVLKTLNDLYDISTLSSFETATFFPVDSVSIPAEKLEDAKKAIEPVAQRIVTFITDHPREKFKAVIMCSSPPDSQEPNVKLGELRAQTVVNLLANQLRSKEEFIPIPERISIKWVVQKAAIGKSRDMVSIIWHVLPASLLQ